MSARPSVDTAGGGPPGANPRALGGVTVLAGLTSAASLVVGLAGADYDFEAFSEAESFIALGAEAADPVLWGFWLSMFGSYLLLAPVALHLWRRQRQDTAQVADLSMLAAAAYILLGAAGAGVLASTLPDMMQQYATAPAGAADQLLARFDFVRRIAEDGLQGVVQNTAGAVWFLGMGAVLRRDRAVVGWLAVLVGVALVVNTLAILIDVESLRTIGLTGHVLLAPLWSIGMGVALLRGR